MARNNDNKMLQAVLLDENLMKFGDYSPSDISTIEQALDSDNYVINAVAQIIKRTGEGASEKELWKEIDKYLLANSTDNLSKVPIKDLEKLCNYIKNNKQKKGA